MASSGGILVMLIMLFDTVIEFDVSDEFWQLIFPHNRSQVFSASLVILETINSMAGPVPL
jgi:hypothetical protein|tara:strand:+ start:388 stop:567 length:180 start_codon:yes stop_codon:yes gene_type:complete